MSDSDSEDSTYQVRIFIAFLSALVTRPSSTPTPPQPSPSPCTSTSTSAPSSSATSPPEQGCAYLQAVSAQIRAGAYATTAGDSYLETIFTHREALFAYPPGHRACAVGFSSLARDLEARSWAARRHSEEGAQEAEWHGYPAVRPDWEGDDEAVAAFRHEAWVIANM